jgi:hypothetical protein
MTGPAAKQRWWVDSDHSIGHSTSRVTDIAFVEWPTGFASIFNSDAEILILHTLQTM